MKKVLVLVLALMVVFAFSVTAFAAVPSDGSITIQDAVKGETYEVYKLFDLTYSNPEGKDDPDNMVDTAEFPVSYTFTKTTANTALYEALTADDSVFKLTQVGSSDKYVVTAKDGKSDEAIIAFVKDLSTKPCFPAPSSSKTASTNGELKFENLEYGYYYLTSTLGTLVTIDSTLKDAVVTDKNEKPEIKKEVKENSTGNFGESNDAYIGDDVEYKITVTAQPGAENYVVHDELSDGLSFKSDTVKVNDGTKDLTASEYTLKTTSLGDDCTFHIEFKKDYLDSITAKKEITITYKATLTKDAVVAETGNENEAKLEYGHKDTHATTPEVKTTTYTWKFDVYKFYMDGSDKKPLGTAKFSVYTDEACTDIVKFDDNGKYDKSGTKTEFETQKADGKFSVELKGLDSGTYYLKETAAPAGYNALSKPVKVEIAKDGTVKADGTTLTNTTVAVENKQGSELPETGGMGTTVLYILGGILVAGAAIVLVTRKRMEER